MPNLPNDVRFPFRGRLVWLTAEQGGRLTGPPHPPDGVYAANAYVPPQTAASGLASFVLRDFEPGALTASAAGCWLVVDNAGPYRIQEGTIVVITEGPKPVGYFHVERIE
ncbi:hypothetical protein AB0J55_30295 [Amycolatopsis sp. NPDC049688]|uniref:hypothetical protein n=1 Tax=Amycolatopsis sp. NPDC049688 TaxID=3154733 RepID=UPI003420C7EF